jgi:hypothetical protein
MPRESKKTPQSTSGQTERSLSRWPVGVVSVVISLVALLFSAETYYVRYRPFVGVIRNETHVVQNDKGEIVGMAWSFVLKNTGAVPALVTLEKNLCQFTTGDRRVDLPVIGEPRGQIILMPDQEANVPAGFPDSGDYKAQDVLSGKTILTVEVELSYTAIGWWWWKRTFIYRFKNRFRHDYFPQAFIMESGFAD